jgi:hypothetical protein
MRIAEASRQVGFSTAMLAVFFFACVLAAAALARGESESARAERALRRALELERERRVREALVAERADRPRAA